MLETTTASSCPFSKLVQVDGETVMSSVFQTPYQSVYQTRPGRNGSMVTLAVLADQWKSGHQGTVLFRLYCTWVQVPAPSVERKIGL